MGCQQGPRHSGTRSGMCRAGREAGRAIGGSSLPLSPLPDRRGGVRRKLRGRPSHEVDRPVIAARDEQMTIPVEIQESRRPVDDRLRLLVERVERLEEEKKGISEDIRDVYNEAKAVGYNVKMMRQIVRLRKMKPDDRREMDMILDTYRAALGID